MASTEYSLPIIDRLSPNSAVNSEDAGGHLLSLILDIKLQTRNKYTLPIRGTINQLRQVDEWSFAGEI